MPNQFESKMPDMNQLLREKDKQVAHIFHPYVKDNFLISMCHEVCNSLPFQKIMEKGRYNDNFSLDAIFKQDYYFDVAANIALSHLYYTTPIREDEHSIAQKYNDKEYRDKIFNSAIEQCNLRLLLHPADSVGFCSHMPIVFAMTCLTNYLIDKLDNYRGAHLNHLMKDQIDLFAFNSLRSCVITTKTILSTFDNGDFSNAYSLTRTLIETFFIYLDLRQNEEGISSYYQFLDFKNQYNETGQFPEEFTNKAPKNSRLWPNYLNYGWLDTIRTKEIKYTFNDIVECCPISQISSDPMWNNIYKRCSNFVHGNLYVVERLDKGVCDISNLLAPLLVNLANYTLLFLDDEKAIYDGIDLVENLKNKNEELFKLTKEIGGDNSSSYKSSLEKK